MNPTRSKFAALMGSASLLTLAGAITAQAQQVAQAQMAAASEEIPEQVLITGSLIRGTAAVGVPVTNLGVQDFTQTGSLTTADLFRSVPAFNVSPGPVGNQAGNIVERATRVNLRQLDTGTAPRTLMMVDGIRVPAQGNGQCVIDPSIIPSISLERVDLLLDGASATYGSDALSGVINLILKRNYEGAVTQARFTTGAGGRERYQISQLWGRSWGGGNVTLSYEFYNDNPIMGNFHSKNSVDFSPYGLDNRIPISSSAPGTITVGNPASPDPARYPANIGHNCTNCFAIPIGTGAPFDSSLNGGIGPTTPFSGSTLNWATFNTAANGGVNGTNNIIDPNSIAWYEPKQQRNGGHIAIDQRLTSNISFYGTGFYSNRRGLFINQANLTPMANNAILVQVPTWNPYYPTGGAPTNLRVGYNTCIEEDCSVRFYELAYRYSGGLNIALPSDWAAHIYYSNTHDDNHSHANGDINKAQVSAALGWTMPTSPATGTTPAIATWAKPATVPYLNLFCDATSVQCNSASTLNYITAPRLRTTVFSISEKGAGADGPLFDLPGGQVKAAVGANYTSYHLRSIFIENTGGTSPIVPYLDIPEFRSVWAVFTQLNVPLIGDANALPGIRSLELEASWRHDQYSDVKGTSNPKVSFNWQVDDRIGLMIRGTWGSSFRAPVFGETSRVANVAFNGFNLPSNIYENPGLATIQVVCNANGQPIADSAGAKLFAAGFGCGSQPAGLTYLGGATVPTDEGLRSYVNQDGQVLRPELALNYGIGFSLTPTTFLRGLDLQATWYSIKIGGLLAGFGNPTTGLFNDPQRGFAHVVPSDMGCPQSQDSTPWLCAPFQDVVANMLANPRNPVGPAAQTLVYWINDGGVFNKGWQKITGIDYQISYDFDAGDLGAFNTGISGTYYLHRLSQPTPGTPPVDELHQNIAPVAGTVQEGVISPRQRASYRARLGWANGPWSVTGFMDYSGHYYHNGSAPPNVNNLCTTAGGTLGGGTFPCEIIGYSNITPSYYTFDLSVGYNTGDTPINDYLKNVNLQFVMQNVTDKHSPFQYRTSASGGAPAVHDFFRSIQGRMFTFIVSKTW